MFFFWCNSLIDPHVVLDQFTCLPDSVGSAEMLWPELLLIVMINMISMRANKLHLTRIT